METAAGFSIPRGDEEGRLAVRTPAVPSLDGKSFQEWAVRLPARLYGWGFRSLEDSCGPAWIGSLESSIPFMAGREQICPQMEEVWGGEECWGEGAPKEDRWRRVLDSGCQEGVELRMVMGPIYREAQLAAAWLGEEVPAVLATPLPGLGATL